MNSIIRFEEPPSARRGGDTRQTNHHENAAVLRLRPKEWALLEDNAPSASVASSYAAAIRTGRLAAYRPRGSYEAVSRKIDGDIHVYARFVGGAE